MDKKDNNLKKGEKLVWEILGAMTDLLLKYDLPIEETIGAAVSATVRLLLEFGERCETCMDKHEFAILVLEDAISKLKEMQSTRNENKQG